MKHPYKMPIVEVHLCKNGIFESENDTDSLDTDIDFSIGFDILLTALKSVVDNATLIPDEINDGYARPDTFSVPTEDIEQACKALERLTGSQPLNRKKVKQCHS